MVSAHPNLHRKFRNTDNIVRANKSDIVHSLQSKFPEDYMSLSAHSTIKRVRPWVDIASPVRLHITESQTKAQNQSLQPMSVDKILILCVDFPDKPHQLPLGTIYDRFFSDIGNSMRNYYKEISYSRYVPHGELYGWYRAPQPSTFYANNENGFGKYPNSAEKLIEDVVELAKNDPNAPIDWASFDTNENGYIDNLVVVHSGAEAAFTGELNDLWAHVYVIPTPKIIQDKSVWVYELVSEYLSIPTDVPAVGVDSHEFGHLLGLPDLYDYSGESNGVGFYSLMGAGSWGGKGAHPVHMDPWSKYVLGFADTTINPTGNVYLRDIERNSNIIKYTTPDPGEYFLIENRQKLYCDALLPSEGLLIWHINENQKYNDNEACFMVGLIQADGLKDLENKANYGDLGDPYPGILNNRSFGINTDPGSKLCNDTRQKLLISNISDSSHTMTFNSSF